MARINIEDSIWKDIRFQDLMIKVGSRHAAKGMMVELWTLAQEFWFPDMKPIPMERIQQCGLEECIAVGLANITADGVFAQGTKEAFAWLFERQDAGKKGGLAKASKAKQKLASAKQSLAKPSKTYPLTPSLSPSPLLSPFSDSSSNSISISKDEKTAVTPPANAGAFIAAYCRVWKARYQSRPEIMGRDQGIAKRLIGGMGTERACELIESFLKMNESWFVQKRHDLGTFEQNLNAVVQFHDTGKTITRQDTKNIETQTYHEQQLKRIALGGSQ